MKRAARRQCQRQTLDAPKPGAIVSDADAILGSPDLEARLSNLAKTLVDARREALCARVQAENAAERAESAERRMIAEMGRFIEARDAAVRIIAALPPALQALVNEAASP